MPVEEAQSFFTIRCRLEFIVRVDGYVGHRLELRLIERRHLGFCLDQVCEAGAFCRARKRPLSQWLPTVIRTEEENEEMLAAIWELMRKREDEFSAEELALLELMSVLVERLDEEHYPIPDSPPHRIL